MTYADYLRSPRWQARREWAIAAAGGRCMLCYAVAALDVHHRTYERLGHELPTDLVALCSACHEAYHHWSAPAPRATEADRHYRRRLAIEASVEAAFAQPERRTHAR
jgi:5-methylcytosine-specific restriction endonuclease McrA